jgi:hypothetical protein
MNLGKEEKQELFKTALETMRYEGALLWQIFNAFLLIHTVFVGFLVQKEIAFSSLTFRPGVFLGSIVGLTLCVPWWASYARNVAHYRYHLAKVRELEPSGWHLYGGDGKAFSSGSHVIVSGEPHTLGRFANRVRSGRMVPPVIMTFCIVYTVILIVTGPWWIGYDA